MECPRESPHTTQLDTATLAGLIDACRKRRALPDRPPDSRELGRAAKAAALVLAVREAVAADDWQHVSECPLSSTADPTASSHYAPKSTRTLPRRAAKAAALVLAVREAVKADDWGHVSECKPPHRHHHHSHNHPPNTHT